MPRNAMIPLNAIRAYEATIRLGSVKAAAKELCVTEGAISRQIKKLENVLELSLARRDQHKIAATAVGNKLAQNLTTALDLVDQAVSEAQNKHTRIRLQVAPSFAIRWLMPRLEQLHQCLPLLDIRVTTTLLDNQFDQYSFDVGIIYGDGKWPNLNTTKLSNEYLLPVVSSNTSTQAVRNFQELTFLHTTVDQRDWKLWVKKSKHDQSVALTGPTFETLDLAVRAAENGFGISLGDLSLIHDNIRANSLKTPFGPMIKTGRGYYLVHEPNHLCGGAINDFKRWLQPQSPIERIDAEAIAQSMGINLISATS
ncbi:LysR substrate-binding domain-containing protein [Kiloniella sp. EL199]|uniref:LysR substrate-binding domain-containing protein n=1 Tax=Kiloniella sp. EL199 TaxID=2107581 RepID=UPI000EA08598|nr:LysR substrate-binding domain-containing protein [Kiloniella sp. EL199]